MAANDNVLVEAMKLSEADRLELAERLYESVEGPADADAEQAWAAEIERRVRAIDSGQGQFMSWEEARRGIVRDKDGGTTP